VKEENGGIELMKVYQEISIIRVCMCMCVSVVNISYCHMHLNVSLFSTVLSY